MRVAPSCTVALPSSSPGNCRGLSAYQLVLIRRKVAVKSAPHLVLYLPVVEGPAAINALVLLESLEQLDTDSAPRWLPALLQGSKLIGAAENMP